MAERRSRLTLVMFPREDERFCARVGSLQGTNGVVPDHLEQRLRTFYPHAIVRPRDPLGELDPNAETWYVYRDGSLSSPGGHQEPAWLEPSDVASAAAD